MFGSDAWLLFNPNTIENVNSGGAVQHVANRQSVDTCASTSGASIVTDFWIGQYAYKSGQSLLSITSEHYAGGLSMEKFFLTKEFGLTKWEAWCETSTANCVANDHSAVCNGPSAVGSWRRLDCREWTVVVPLVRRPLGYNLNAYAIELPATWASGNTFGNANLLRNGDAGHLDLQWWQVARCALLACARLADATARQGVWRRRLGRCRRRRREAGAFRQQGIDAGLRFVVNVIR